MKKRLQWIGCWFAYRVWMVLPMWRGDGWYWRFSLWLIQYAGAYAHSEDFTWFRDNVRFDRCASERGRG